MNNISKKKKIVLIFSIITLALLVLIGGTVAFFGWRADDTLVNVTISSGTGSCKAVSNNNAYLYPVASQTNGRIIKLKANQLMGNAAYITWTMVVNQIDNLQHESFMYELVNYTTGVSYGKGNFADITAEEGSNTITFSSSDERLAYNTDYQFYLYLWIDGTNFTNPIEMTEQTFDFDISCTITGTTDYTDDVTEAEFEGGGLITHIANLYNTSSKEKVTNNASVYHYAPAVSLMSDRLGGVTGALNAGNLRYYGANPNNYVDLGDTYTKDTEIGNFEKNKFLLNEMQITTPEACYQIFDCENNYATNGYESSEACYEDISIFYFIFGAETVGDICGSTIVPAGTPILYRIIGLFKDIELSDGTKKDLVKVVRDDSIGNFSWNLVYDSDVSNVSIVNDWTIATLNSILNNEYYNSQSVDHWYFLGDLSDEEVEPTLITTDLSSIGLSSLVHDKIETVKWNLGGHSTSKIYTNLMYRYERGATVYSDNPTEWNGKIALMYPSDYGYAVDFRNCSDTLYNYSDSGCSANNWLSFESSRLLMEWFLTPLSSTPYYTYSLTASYINDTSYSYDSEAVRPSFFLNSDLDIISGTGTKNSPYVVG